MILAIEMMVMMLQGTWLGMMVRISFLRPGIMTLIGIITARYAYGVGQHHITATADAAATGECVWLLQLLLLLLVVWCVSVRIRIREIIGIGTGVGICIENGIHIQLLQWTKCGQRRCAEK